MRLAGEIHNVLTALRLTSSARRRAYLHHSAAELEEPLLRGLKQLHEQLSQARALLEVDTRAVLEPFLAVIECAFADAHVTLTALQSAHKFLVYQHIHQDSPNVDEAVGDLAYCVTHARFEAASWEDAEVVYTKILEVLLECLRSPAGHLLTDDAVCSMVRRAAWPLRPVAWRALLLLPPAAGARVLQGARAARRVQAAAALRRERGAADGAGHLRAH